MTANAEHFGGSFLGENGHGWRSGKNALVSGPRKRFTVVHKVHKTKGRKTARRGGKKKPRKKTKKLAKLGKYATCAEYAKYRGVSVRAVYKAIKTERIKCELVNRKRRIEVHTADRDWDNNTKDQYHSDPEPESPPDLGDDIDADLDRHIDKGNAGEKRRIAEAKKLIWEARQVKLKFLKDAGELVAVDKVKNEAFKLARIVRDAVLNIPDRISAELAGIKDQARMHSVLTRELNTSLQELVNGLETK